MLKLTLYPQTVATLKSIHSAFQDHLQFCWKTNPVSDSHQVDVTSLLALSVFRDLGIIPRTMLDINLLTNANYMYISR